MDLFSRNVRITWLAISTVRIFMAEPTWLLVLRETNYIQVYIHTYVSIKKTHIHTHGEIELRERERKREVQKHIFAVTFLVSLQSTTHRLV